MHINEYEHIFRKHWMLFERRLLNALKAELLCQDTQILFGLWSKSQSGFKIAKHPTFRQWLLMAPICWEICYYHNFSVGKLNIVSQKNSLVVFKKVPRKLYNHVSKN